MTLTSLSRSKGQRSRSPDRFAHRRVGASGGCSGGRGKVLTVGNCCYAAVCSAAQGASAPTGEERGGVISGQPPRMFRLPAACLGYSTVAGRYIGRRMVVARSNCSRIVVVTTALSTEPRLFLCTVSEDMSINKRVPISLNAYVTYHALTLQGFRR